MSIKPKKLTAEELAELETDSVEYWEFDPDNAGRLGSLLAHIAFRDAVIAGLVEIIGNIDNFQACPTGHRRDGRVIGKDCPACVLESVERQVQNGIDMTTDLVDMLREEAQEKGRALYHAAADEIERLKRERDVAREALSTIIVFDGECPLKSDHSCDLEDCLERQNEECYAAAAYAVADAAKEEADAE